MTKKITAAQLKAIRQLLTSDDKITSRGTVVTELADDEWEIHFYHKATTEALIRKGILIPEIPDKEFAVQQAIGSMKHRLYHLANRKKKWEEITRD